MTGALPRIDDSSSTPDSEAGFGALETAKGPLPLKAMDVKAHITGLLYNLTVVQTFVNTHEEPIEAVYIFPLPPRAAVNAFSMKVGDHTVDGKLMERGMAREGYQKALAAGKRASMAEEDRPNVFTLSVGNLMPRDIAEVTFQLSGLVVLNGDEAEWRFPLVVAPRYIPGTPLGLEPAGLGTNLDTDQVPDASRLTPPILLPGFPNPVRLGIEVELDPCDLGFTDLRSSLHAVDVETSGKVRHIRLAYEERLNRDFILRFRLPAESLKCSALLIPDAKGKTLDKDSGDATLMVTIIPPQPKSLEMPPKDVVFVLDRSGSMGGWKISAARRAMARMVDTLHPRDRFGVIAFDTEMLTLGLDKEGLLPATDRNRFRAAEFLAKVEVDGGTEMLPPIRLALKTLGNQETGRDQIVFLVTDGEVGNEAPLIQKVQHGHTHCRVQVIGIGESANDSLLQRMASVSKGWFLSVEGEHTLDSGLLEAARRFGKPIVENLQISGPGLLLKHTVSSGTMDLYPGTPLIVLTRVNTPDMAYAGDLHGFEAGNKIFECHLAAARAKTVGISSVWARWRIRDLEDTGGKRDEILATSLAHGVLSRYTAFLALDDRGTVNPGGSYTTLVQPVEDDDDSLHSCGLIRGSSRPNAYSGSNLSPSPSSSEFNDECEYLQSSMWDASQVMHYRLIMPSMDASPTPPSAPMKSLDGATYDEALDHARMLEERTANQPYPVTKRWLKDLAKEMVKLKSWLLAQCIEQNPAIQAFIELTDRLSKAGQANPIFDNHQVAWLAKTVCAELHEWLSANPLAKTLPEPARRFWED